MSHKKLFIIVFVLNLFSYNIKLLGQSITKLGPNYYVAGVSSIDFFPVVANGRQRCPEWCWAASIQMILNYHGLFVNQEQIVNRIFGSLTCHTATIDDIREALSGWALDYRGGFSEIQSKSELIESDDIVRNLGRKWPLLVCIDNGQGGGHALVMTAVYYSVDQENNAIIDKVVLRDPFPGSESRQEISWNAISGRIQNVVRIWVNRL